MRDWKGQEHSWPRRLPSERRVHPRVAVGFPLHLVEQGSGAEVPAVVTDLSLGGMRVAVPRHLAAGASVAATFELVVTTRSGAQESHRFSAPATVMRATPDASDGASEFELSLQFDADDNERERIIGIFMLQTLLFVPGAVLR